jgi:hypothetical protein
MLAGIVYASVNKRFAYPLSSKRIVYFCVEDDHFSVAKVIVHLCKALSILFDKEPSSLFIAFVLDIHFASLLGLQVIGRMLMQDYKMVLQNSSLAKGK